MLLLWNASGTFRKVFDLPVPGRYRLARPPLAEALAQIRFPLRAHLNTLDGVAPVQDHLNALFPYMTEQHVQQVTLLGQQGGPPQAESQTSRAWRFTDDAGWTLLLAADSVSLSAGAQYGAFDEFVSRFERVLGALAEAGGVARCDRLGVRYINIAPVPVGIPDDWRGWFRPELTGWSATNVVGDQSTLLTSIAQTQLSARPVGELSGPPVDIQAIIRHGYIPPGIIIPGMVQIQPAQQAAFLLDIDLFVEAPQSFDTRSLIEQLEILHRQIDMFFRWSLAAAGENYFGLEELA